MPTKTALDNARTGTPDGTLGIPIATLAAQEGGSIEIPGTFLLSDRIPDAPTADKNPATAADTATDMSSAGYGTSLVAVNNAGALSIFCSFENSAESITLRVIFYDSAGNPLFVSELLTFTPLVGFRLSASGHYMTEAQLVDTKGASKFKPYIVSKTNAIDDVKVWCCPL